MRQVVVDIPSTQYAFFMELIARIGLSFREEREEQEKKTCWRLSSTV